MDFIVAVSFFTAEGRLFRTDYSEPMSWEEALACQDAVEANVDDAAIMAEDIRADYLKVVIQA